MFSVMLQINWVLRSDVFHVWNKLNGFQSSEQIIVRTGHPYFTLLSFVIWRAFLCLSKQSAVTSVWGLTIKFANSPLFACCGSSGQKHQYGLITLAYKRFTAMLLLIYGSLFLSGMCYCLSVFSCAVARVY
jgi:hypothetical protein